MVDAIQSESALSLKNLQNYNATSMTLNEDKENCSPPVPAKDASFLDGCQSFTDSPDVSSVANGNDHNDESMEVFNGDFQLADYTAPPREKPIIHEAADPPLCDNCRKMELAFFDPNCPECQNVLFDPHTSIPEIFAILRQWTPQTQQNLEMLIREILKRGANPNDRDGLTDMTMLHYTVKAGAQGIGDLEEACRMTTLLLQKGADVFVRCRWTNMTALHYAVYFDVAPIVKMLLDASQGIDIHSQCTEFEHGTPLHIATLNLAYDSAKILLQYNANPTAKDDLGRTSIECLPDGTSFIPETGMSEILAKLKNLIQETQYDEAKHEVKFALPDDTNAMAALDALGLKIGEKVIVGGVKTGILRYCGPAEFASGLWAGIELEEPAGKNDGSVSGISYFRCSPKYGIFAPLSKITKPIPGQLIRLPPPKPVNITVGKVDVSKVTSRIDTGLKKGQNLSLMGNPVEEEVTYGDKVIVAGQRRGLVRYIGDTDFAPGLWYGIELERPVGKNDGTVNGKKYFTCKPKHGVFAPPTRVQKFSEYYGSRESLESLGTYTDRSRRLSGGNQQHFNTSTPTSNKKTSQRPGKSKLHSISELTPSRPKSSGNIGQMRRTLSSPPDFCLQEGMSVLCNNELGMIRYIGPVDFAEGIWLGVELRTAKGKNDGAVQGKRYFQCKSSHGLIVRPSKVTVRGINGAKLLGDAFQDNPDDSKDSIFWKNNTND